MRLQLVEITSWYPQSKIFLLGSRISAIPHGAQIKKEKRAPSICKKKAITVANARKCELNGETASDLNGFTVSWMGNAVGVALPPERREAIRLASIDTVSRAHHAALVAQDRVRRLARVAERWYAVVDERVLSKVHHAVEKQVLERIERLMDQAEVKSKVYFAKAISTSTIASAFDIDVAE